MTPTAILTRAEVETMGPPVPEELADTGVVDGFLGDLALKHVAMLPEPATHAIAERLHLPRTLTEELLQSLYREKLIEVRNQSTMGATRYAMLDHGWQRVSRLISMCGYTGAAPVSLRDYGAFATARFQRSTLQLWQQDVPFADAGTVTPGNAGDLAKAAGLWPGEAAVPGALP